MDTDKVRDFKILYYLTFDTIIVISKSKNQIYFYLNKTIDLIVKFNKLIKTKSIKILKPKLPCFG